MGGVGASNLSAAGPRDGLLLRGPALTSMLSGKEQARGESSASCTRFVAFAVWSAAVLPGCANSDRDRVGDAQVATPTSDQVANRANRVVGGHPGESANIEQSRETYF